MNINLKKNVLECQIYYYKFYKKFIKNIQFFKGEFLFKEKFLYYNSMNNNLTFSYNNKVYKTEAAMKKAKTMDAKRANKQVKIEAYAVSEKKQKREATIDSKKIRKQNQKTLLKQMKNIIKKDLMEFVGFILLQILNKYYTLIMFIVKKVAIKRMNYQMHIKQKLK